LFFYVVSFVHCIVLLRNKRNEVKEQYNGQKKQRKKTIQWTKETTKKNNTMDKRNDVKEQYNGQKKRRKRTIQWTKETT
jgi:mannitol-specific phosphotransferase system IIBC component